MESARSENEVSGASSARPILSAEGMAVLQAALGGKTGDRDAMSSPALKNALRQICAEAKVRNWPPELLLIAFKAALNTVPAVKRLTRGPDRDEFVARLVSLCIDEYYAGPRG